MPESPKMGLFGSKDETKKEIGDGTPGNYQFSYDTEALSMMDINDIIGVHSEPVSDSTLESEIAALSQMITESKTDASQTGTERKHSTKEKGAIENERTRTIDDSDGINTVNISEHSKSTLEELENVHNADTEINSNVEQSSKETNVKQSFQLCKQQENNDAKDNCESDVLSESITVMDNKVIDEFKAVNETGKELIQFTSDSISTADSTVAKSKENVNISNVCKQENIVTAVNSEVTIVGNKNNICGSLKLIGEAYSSEDSQEAALNNEEIKEPSLTTSSNEKCLTPIEGNSNTNKIGELKDVSNIPEGNVSSDVITMDKNVVIETIESEKLCNVKVDSSSSYVKSEHAEELPITSEDTKNVPNKCEIDSPSNNVLQLEEKNFSIVTTDTDVEGILEGKEIDIQVTKETVAIESSEMEIIEKDVKQTDDICVTENESKVNVIEESKFEEDLKEGMLEVNITEEKPEVVKDEMGESMVVKEKENHENEEKNASQEDKENVSILDSDQVLNAESNDKINADNDAEVIEQQNEMEIKSKQLEVHLENLKNSASDLEKIDLLQVTDSSEKAESHEVELAEIKEDMEIEKLQSEIKLQETSQTPIASNEQISITSVENPIPILQDGAELVSDSGNLVNTANLVEDGETDKELKNEEENNLDSLTSEMINNEVAENVNAELCTIQTKVENELKINEESSDVVDKCEIPVEVDLNKDSVNSMVEIDASDNDIDSTNIVATGDDCKNRLDQPLEEDTNKITERIEVKHIEAKEIENYISQEQIEKSEEVKSEGTLNVSDNITSTGMQLEDKTFSELYEDIEVEIQTKEKLEIIEKQVVEQEIMEKEIEKEKIIEEQMKEGNRIEKQTEEDIERTSCKNVKVEQSTETKNESVELENNENIDYLMEENQVEQSEENVIRKETEDMKIKETTHAEEGNASDLKFINKDVFSSLEQFEMEEPEEEDHMEDEMILTFEEENDSQVDTVKSDLEEKLENENVKDSTKFAEDQGDSVVKMDVDTSDSLNAEESNTIEINLQDVDNSGLNKNEMLSDKQESEDNDSKSDTSKDNLETANNINEMISEDQCQNTQDIVTSILDNEDSATDFKNILSTEAVATNEIEEALQQSEIAETELEELTEKLPQDSEDILNKDMEDSNSTQNIDSLEGLLDLDLIQEEEDSSMKVSKTEEELQNTESLSKEVEMSLLLEESNHTSDMAQASDYISHVISSCLTDRDVSLDDNVKKPDAIEDAEEDKIEETNVDDILKVDEDILPESINKVENIEDLQKDLTESAEIPDNELDIDFVEAPLESVVDLEETESKLELTSDILLDSVDQGENLNDPPSGVETSQPSSEISELESAVKFLQESEEQAMDSPLVLSPKMVESVVDDISKEAVASTLFVSDEDMCENTTELEAELQNIATDSIAISEAEIISEAVKLESERKLAEQIKTDALQEKFELDNDLIEEKISEESEIKFDIAPLENIEMQQVASLEKSSEIVMTLSPSVLKISESIPKISILEERLKEPPKIEIPSTDLTKVSLTPTTSKDSLLIQKDAKVIAYQRMLESPKLSEKLEPKITETPRKDSEKHDFENVGSPRIILKIAKSAIADCGEPRSPKSPKIRSATNSPNPEDSPGQKLGKIKLKLSKGGHPSIISNENIEEAVQWYTEGSSSLSPMGMKIKLSKVGDASIISSERHESMDDSKEGKYRHEEMKRTESPIGMKIKLSKSGDASIVQQDSKEVQMKHKDKLDMVQGSPKRTESPIGMKFKLSKTGDASIIQPEKQDFPDEYKDNAQMKAKEKHEPCYGSPKRIDSPLGMKIKLSKTGDVSIVSPDLPDESRELCKVKEKLESSPEIAKRTESPIGMKIKLTKTKGGASIISVENSEEPKDKLEISDVPKRTESPLGMKIKLSKTGDASIVHSEVSDETKEKVDMVHNTTKSLELPCGMKIKVTKLGETIAHEIGEESVTTTQEVPTKIESSIGMKIKLSKFGDASIVPSEKQEQSEESKLIQDIPKRTESPLGMKIKLLKTGDASIIQPETSEDTNKTVRTSESEHCKATDSTLGMKIKLLKTGDASILDPEKKERTQRRRDIDSSLEMKIKISKTGHPTIVACENQPEATYRSKEVIDPQNFVQRYKEVGQAGHKEPPLKILKTSHSTILQSSRSELTIEPVQVQGKKPDNTVETPSKRKDITISPIESKKAKMETQLNQMLPEVTIQPVTPREQKQFLFDPKSNTISPQQMNVINQEISITQVRPQKPADTTMSEKLKHILSKNSSSSPIHSDCEIIEHRPELIIVNENSNSSQDVMIIEEVSSTIIPEVKMPKRRGRPRRTPLPVSHHSSHLVIPKDPLSLDDTPQIEQQPQISHFPESRENERPKRTCRSQKSYAPPRRSRGRGRGKRKLDAVEHQIVKKARIEQDLNAIEASTTAVITIDDSGMQQESFIKSPELYKVLKQPTMDSKIAGFSESADIQIEINKVPLPKPVSNDIKDNKKSSEIVCERMQKTPAKMDSDNRTDKTPENTKSENKDMLVPPGHPNWLTPTSKRVVEGSTKHENVSTVQVIDEETRMSAESGSRSQTPARNISAPASETIINEESQGSVLSTATTESEKVKVKNRRMEINFDPDEGPFTVDKIAEYEWPLDRKGETFMIQEQISQYLGVKSFKRKYPDLKRRVVDMEERNYLRENALVSESMCDMGLTAICSSEVLDVMCSDFPDQYEEYRKHMREKQVKEHSKKQKELTAAANAEKNRIDLAEMAVQSALSWNVSLNKARRESRKCSLDLQTFTIHVPKKQQKVDAERRIGHYPVALIPGQYTDYYREYTPAELRYYPLNTVLYGPMRPNERKFDSQSEGSQSDSDSDSSSDDSSSSSSEGTQDTEGSQSTIDDVDMEINHKDEMKLKCKMCLKSLNKLSKNEVLIQCGTCNGHVHPSCIDLTLDMVPHIQSYAWQCTDCKTCAQCHDPADEDKMLFCDMCDRGYHIYCVGLRRVPQGRWHCQECAVCANCGSREAGGMNSDRNSVAQWQHEYKKGDKNTRVYVSTLCVPCSKMRGDQGNHVRQEKLSV